LVKELFGLVATWFKIWGLGLTLIKELFGLVATWFKIWGSGLGDKRVYGAFMFKAKGLSVRTDFALEAQN
jgi:hypothetical protein